MPALLFGVPVTFSANLPFIEINFNNIENHRGKSINIVLKNISKEILSSFVYVIQETNTVELQNVPFGGYTLELNSNDSDIEVSYIIKSNGNPEIKNNIIKNDNSNNHPISLLAPDNRNKTRFGFGGMMTSGSFMMMSSGF